MRLLLGMDSFEGRILYAYGGFEKGRGKKRFEQLG